MDRQAVVVALLLAVVLAGCQGVDQEATPSPDERTPTAEPTITPSPAPVPSDDGPDTGFGWRVGQAVGTNLTDDTATMLVRTPAVTTLTNLLR